MAATKGNQFWQLRSKHGRDKIFSEADILWDECVKYFEATDERKWNKTEYNGKDAIKCLIPLDTPYTWTGLYYFLGISHTAWQEYEKREDFNAICTRVRYVIYTQKFEGAAVGVFHANIIARDLGLTEKSALQVTEQPLFPDVPEDAGGQ